MLTHTIKTYKRRCWRKHISVDIGNSKPNKREGRNSLVFFPLLLLPLHFFVSPKVSFNRGNSQTAGNNVNNKFNKLLATRQIENNLITVTLCGSFNGKCMSLPIQFGEISTGKMNVWFFSCLLLFLVFACVEKVQMRRYFITIKKKKKKN